MRIEFTVGEKDFEFELKGLKRKWELINDSELEDEIRSTLVVFSEKPEVDFDYGDIAELDPSVTFVLFKTIPSYEYGSLSTVSTSSPKKQAMKEFTEYLKNNYQENAEYTAIDVKTLEETKINIEEKISLDITY